MHSQPLCGMPLALSKLIPLAKSRACIICFLWKRCNEFSDVFNLKNCFIWKISEFYIQWLQFLSMIIFISKDQNHVAFWLFFKCLRHWNWKKIDRTKKLLIAENWLFLCFFCKKPQKWQNVNFQLLITFFVRTNFFPVSVPQTLGLSKIDTLLKIIILK